MIMSCYHLLPTFYFMPFTSYSHCYDSSFSRKQHGCSSRSTRRSLKLGQRLQDPTTSPRNNWILTRQRIVPVLAPEPGLPWSRCPSQDFSRFEGYDRDFFRGLRARLLCCGRWNLGQSGKLCFVFAPGAVLKGCAGGFSEAMPTIRAS